MQRAILSRPLSMLFVLPAAIFLVLFLFYPFFAIIQMSFTNQALVGANALNPQNVGLQNYTDLFNFEDWMRRGELGHILLLTAQFVIFSALIGQAGLLLVPLSGVAHCLPHGRGAGSLADCQ